MSPPLPALAGSVLSGLHTSPVGYDLMDSPAGAYPSGKLGEEPRGKPGNLLPLLAQIAIGREKSDLKIFGNDYPTPYVFPPSYLFLIPQLSPKRAHALAITR